VSAAATGNPMKRLSPDQKVGPSLMHCHIHSTSHQPPFNRYGMCTILQELWTDARSSCKPCSPANANITCMPTAKCCPHWHLIQKHAWRSQGITLFCPIHTTHSDAMTMLSFGTGQARAPVSRFVHMPDFACFQIHTLQPSGPNSSAPFPTEHILSKRI
jgi:hypothetical protein